jgi:hypothetical protein
LEGALAKGLKKEILKSPKCSHFSRRNNIIKIKEKLSSSLGNLGRQFTFVNSSCFLNIDTP